MKTALITGITGQDGNYIANKTKAFIMSQQNSVDIDTEIDFKLCEVNIYE